MVKPKVNGISKDLGIDKKELLELINRVGTKTKSSISTLESNELDIIFDYFTALYSVENFEFLEQKAKKAATVVVSEDLSHEEIIAEVEQATEKRERRVDTRASNVDLEKFDTEKIEGLIREDVSDDVRHKEKIKKGGRKPENRSNNVENKDSKQSKAKREILKILVPDEITVAEFAERAQQSPADVVKVLMQLGIMATINQVIDFDTAELIATEFNAVVEREIIITEDDLLINDFVDNEADLESRPPVVVVMGHVDHGKTSLLDAIRETNVIESEAGGITQHIGAHRVKISDREITFLDTPGHEAFTSMRARGAQVTDIAILVVAADDGIMPQTIEAINHAKAANITVIVAINKIDKEGANPDKIKQELTEYGMVPEEWGGETICVPISAKQRQNLDTLLEMVLLVADMKALKANPNRPAKGTVIEAKLDKNKGTVASILVQNGTLKVGDLLIAGTCVGRVRAMVDDKGKKTKLAGPSIPVEILGLNEAPEGGDLFYVVNDERRARSVVERRKQKQKAEMNKVKGQIVSLDALFEQIKDGDVKELNLIIKADVQGSVEAIRQSLEKLSNDEVRVRIVHGGVGGVSESDIMLASASRAIIIGFNVRPSADITESAVRQGVEIRLYRVIYQAIEDVEAAMKGMLDPIYQEKVLGHAEVRNVFKLTGVGVVAGCYVNDGHIERNSEVRLVRDSVVIYEGLLSSLKRFKDDVKEVASGYECGIGFDKYNDLKVGDTIESFIMEEIER